MSSRTQQGYSLSEFGTALDVHFNTRRKPGQSLYAQVLLPTLDCTEPSIDNLSRIPSSSFQAGSSGSSLSERIKLLVQYAMRDSPASNLGNKEELPSVAADRKGKKTARTLAAEAKMRKEQGSHWSRTILLQRVVRRLLCSQSLLETVLDVTGCKFL